MNKLFAVLICISLLSIINYVETIALWNVYTNKYNWYPFPRYLDTSLEYLVISILVLIFSFLLRNLVHLKSVLYAGIITGITAFCISFILIIFVAFGGYDIPKSLFFSFLQGINGFLFPLLYRLFNKKPLFNEDFY